MCGTLNHYYEATQVKVLASGWYVFSSNSSINAYAYLYQNYFNPSNPMENYLDQDVSSCSNGQFRLAFNLQSDRTYVLLVTTFSPEETGDFEVYASGISKVTFKRISKFFFQLIFMIRRRKGNFFYELFHYRQKDRRSTILNYIELAVQM